MRNILQVFSFQNTEDSFVEFTKKTAKNHKTKDCDGCDKIEVWKKNVDIKFGALTSTFWSY